MEKAISSGVAEEEERQQQYCGELSGKMWEGQGGQGAEWGEKSPWGSGGRGKASL